MGWPNMSPTDQYEYGKMMDLLEKKGYRDVKVYDMVFGEIRFRAYYIPGNKYVGGTYFVSTGVVKTVDLV